MPSVILLGTSVVLLGKNIPGHLPEFGRRNGNLVPKHPRKVGFLMVSQLITNFGDRFLRMHQQVLGFDEFACFNDFGHAFLKVVFANEVEVAFGHVHFLGVEGHAFVPAEVFFQNAEKIRERGHLRNLGTPFHGQVALPFRFNHGNQGGSEVPDGRHVWVLPLKFIINNDTQAVERVHAARPGERDAGRGHEIGVKTQLGIWDELVLELDDPTAEVVALHHSMHLAHRNVTGRRCLDHFHLKIDVMFQAAFGHENQFLEIVEMRILAIGSNLFNKFFGNLYNDERLLHKGVFIVRKYKIFSRIDNTS